MVWCGHALRMCNIDNCLAGLLLQYVGLFHESMGEEAEAERAILTAVQTPYAQQSGNVSAKLCWSCHLVSSDEGHGSLLHHSWPLR